MEHDNYTCTHSSQHICAELQILNAATKGTSNIGVSSDGIDPAFEQVDEEEFETSSSASLLGGVSAPISFNPRHLQIKPRSARRSFDLSVCWPCGSTTACPNPQCHDGSLCSEVDARGVVLFESGEQIEVEVMKSACLSCNSSYIYDGANDKLLVMERSAKNDHKLILVDEHWFASIVRKFFYSKDSFSDIFSYWEKEQALMCSADDGDEPSGTVITLSKTKFIEYTWMFATHLIAPFLPENAMSCSACGSRPNVLVLDGLGIGLLKRLQKTQFHTVPSNQLHFEKVRSCGSLCLIHCHLSVGQPY